MITFMTWVGTFMVVFGLFFGVVGALIFMPIPGFALAILGALILILAAILNSQSKS